MVAFKSLFTAIALSAVASASAVPPTKRQGSEFGWCNALRATCKGQITNKDYEDFFARSACLFGSACPPDFYGPVDGPLPQRRNVQLFLRAVVADKDGPGREPPHAEDLRVPDSVSLLSPQDQAIHPY